MPDTCPSRNDLHDFAVGKLPEEAADLLVQHLAECPVCDETIVNLGVSSDTLVASLARKADRDPHLEEPELRSVLSLIEAIGVQPSASDEAQCIEESLGSVGGYELLAKIGQGGMGTVYKALHQKLDKIVALKVLPADRMQNAGAVTRFEREMKAVGKLNHPNIVAAHDAGEADGRHYLVMELVDGVDLSALVPKQANPECFSG